MKKYYRFQFIINDDKFINVLVKHCSRNRAKKLAVNKLIKKFKTHNIKYVIFDIVYRDEKWYNLIKEVYYEQKQYNI